MVAFTGIPSPLPLRHPSLIPNLRHRPCLPHLPTRVRISAQLIGMPEGFGQNVTPDDNEVLLAELRFSQPDRLPGIIQNSLPKLDESFYQFLEDKINASSDIPERDTLRMLRDAITDIMKSLYEQVEKSGGSASAGPGASEVKNEEGELIDVSSGGQEVATASYDELVDQLLAAENVKVVVDACYERIDLRFLERLSERLGSAVGEASSKLVVVRDTINAAMNERVSAAMEAVKAVLATGNPDAMKKEMNTLARKGKIDDAFILLLQANLEQAQQAGAEQAVKVVSMVLEHARGIKEIGLNPEIRLLRALLRTADGDARREMLMEGLKPRGNVVTDDGKKSTAVTRVDGKQFVTALRKLIEEFGNVDEAFVLKLSAIGEESERVARKLFDMEGKDIADMQEEAFHKRTVSIWDLERIEVEEEMEGRDAAWEGRLGPIPEGFSPEGKMEV